MVATSFQFQFRQTDYDKKGRTNMKFIYVIITAFCIKNFRFNQTRVTISDRTSVEWFRSIVRHLIKKAFYDCSVQNKSLTSKLNVICSIKLLFKTFLYNGVFAEKIFAVCAAFIIVHTYRKFSDSTNDVKPAANSLQNICIGKRVEVRSLLLSN